MTLTDIVQRNDTALGRTFDAVVIFLIMYLILTLCVGTLPNLPESAKFYLEISDYIVFALFTIEYILRVVTAPNKRKYIFSFFGILDLIAFAALLPFFGNRAGSCARFPLVRLHTDIEAFQIQQRDPQISSGSRESQRRIGAGVCHHSNASVLVFSGNIFFRTRGPT